MFDLATTRVKYTLLSELTCTTELSLGAAAVRSAHLTQDGRHVAPPRRSSLLLLALRRCLGAALLDLNLRLLGRLIRAALSAAAARGDEAEHAGALEDVGVAKLVPNCVDTGLDGSVHDRARRANVMSCERAEHLCLRHQR